MPYMYYSTEVLKRYSAEGPTGAIDVGIAETCKDEQDLLAVIEMMEKYGFKKNYVFYELKLKEFPC